MSNMIQTFINVVNNPVTELNSIKFDYIYDYDESAKFQLICLMRKDKYETLPTGAGMYGSIRGISGIALP